MNLGKHIASHYCFVADATTNQFRDELGLDNRIWWEPELSDIWSSLVEFEAWKQWN